MSDSDTIQRFFFDEYDIRGEIVHLNETYQTITEMYEYPLFVKKTLGEALAATALLVGTIKLKGAITLQIKSEGALKFLLAQGNEDFHLRGMARWDEPLGETFVENIGKGTLAIQIDHDHNVKPYEAVVPLAQESLSVCLEDYFTQSEQLTTALFLFADEHAAAGLLLQRMPTQVPDQKQHWQHLLHLTKTITANELLHLSNMEALHRLYHQEQVQLFESEVTSFRCSCTIAKMESALRMLSHHEAQEILEEEQKVTMQCDFCNRIYEFDEIDISRVFHEGAMPPSSDSTH